MVAMATWASFCTCRRHRDRARTVHPLLQYIPRPWTPSIVVCLQTPAGRLWISLPSSSTLLDLREVVRDATGVQASVQRITLAANFDGEPEVIRSAADMPIAELGLKHGASLHLLNSEVRLPSGFLKACSERIAQIFSRSDVVIRGGTIVDGTGSPPFQGDIAIDGALITAVGHALAVRGAFEVDARGLLVAPGWVDVHTHFDGQVTWDPLLTPSGLCGVTTCIMGSCGIGFAPCRRRQRRFLVSLVEAVEDIPGTALHQGISWEWETFEEYLDALERRELVCDVGAMVGHAAVRTWVLGRRANLSDRPGGAREHPVQPREIEQMAAVVRDAVAAGALGFSTSRILLHRDASGVLTPGTLASAQEMLAIGDAVVAGGGGIVQLAQDFATYDDVGRYDRVDEELRQQHSESEWEWMMDMVLKHRQSLALSYVVTTAGGEASDLPLARLGHLNYRGVLARAQVLERPQAVLMSFDSAVHPFVDSSTFRSIPGRDRVACLRAGGALRSRVLSETELTVGGLVLGLVGAWDRVFPWTAGYEPPAELSLRAEAARRGCSPQEAALDALLQDGGRGVLWSPLFQYPEGSLQATWRALVHPHTVPGGADAGAHATVIQDATSATHLLTHWARDRTRGPRIPLETVVRKQTQDAASLFGLLDRGVLAAGKRADLNVIDHAALELLPPRYAFDLPGGAGRWLQDVRGYRLTLLAGKVTLQDGRPTGQMPGRLVRNPRGRRDAWCGAARAVPDPDEGSGGEGRAPRPARAPEREGGQVLGLSMLGRALRQSAEGQEHEDLESEDDGPSEEALEPIKGKNMCEVGCAVL